MVIREELLDFDFGASGDESLLVLFGFDRGDVLFDRGGDGVDELLGIHQAKAGDGLDGFDDGDLGAGDALEDEGDLGGSLGGSGFFFRSRGGRDGGSGGDAEGFFDELDEVVELEDGVLLQAFDDFFFGEFSHGIFPPMD